MLTYHNIMGYTSCALLPASRCAVHIIMSNKSLLSSLQHVTIQSDVVHLQEIVISSRESNVSAVSGL